ncbi:MAG: class 1 fructose-bisphosphatase [Gammaproteobacteria bacterium]|nr:class 1 fructose-bisphosphatase [Gammaproteobacteria bacterium]
MTSTRRLDQYLTDWAQGDPERETIRRLIKALADAGVRLSKVIAAHDSADQVQVATERNSAVEQQNPLGAIAHGIFEAALRELPLSFLASEERDELMMIDPQGRFGVAIDPLDGSSNIETNLSIGSIFSILEVRADELCDIELGDRQRAAGFLFFGPQTRLILSCGEGTVVFLLDLASEQFCEVCETVRIPPGKYEFAINTSNYRFWDSSLRHFIDDCIAGEEGPLGENYNMRWNAALVAETYRVLRRGGVFLYPGDTRPNYRSGRLCLLYEALPMAMLIEQAGGAASDGGQRILDMKLSSLHARVPLIFGSQDRVREVIDYISGEALNSGHFPLFVNRSLLRN